MKKVFLLLFLVFFTIICKGQNPTFVPTTNTQQTTFNIDYSKLAQTSNPPRFYEASVITCTNGICDSKTEHLKVGVLNQKVVIIVLGESGFNIHDVSLNDVLGGNNGYTYSGGNLEMGAKYSNTTVNCVMNDKKVSYSIMIFY